MPGCWHMDTIEVDFMCSAIICHLFIEPGPMLNAEDILLNNNNKKEFSFYWTYRLTVGGEKSFSKVMKYIFKKWNK